MKRFPYGVGLTCLLVVTALAADQDAGTKKIEVTGTLHTGIAAIGGETTGIVVETKQGTYELDLVKNPKLREEAEKLDGRAVEIIGTLQVRQGVEVKERRIITVSSLKAVDQK